MTAVVPNINNEFTLGRGALFFAPFAPGTQTPMGERFLGDCKAVKFTFKSTDLDHYGSVSGVKELDFSVPLQVDRSGGFTTENIDSDNVALFFLGDKASISQSTATVTNEVVSGVKQGYWYQLGATLSDPVGNRFLNSGTAAVITDDGGSPVTFVVGDDYLVDYDTGRIFIVVGGDIEDDTNLKATYRLLAGTYDQVVSGNTAIEGQLRFVSFNPTDEQRDVLAPWVRITPNGDFSLIDDKLSELAFDLKLLKKTAYGNQALYINGRGVGA
jgi:hypothetical protein